MLVLSRRLGEEIVIGKEIRVVVTAVQKKRVNLGISAPATVRVDRQERVGHRSRPPRKPDSGAEEVNPGTNQEDTP